MTTNRGTPSHDGRRQTEKQKPGCWPWWAKGLAGVGGVYFFYWC
jgi:hypothetical protein